VTTGAEGLLRRAGTWNRITPEDAGWRFLSFTVARLNPGARFEQTLETEETAAVLLSGSCTAAVDDERFSLGPRPGVFDALPWTVYAPRGAHVRIETDSGAELAVASAPCERRQAPVLQRPEDVDIEIRGAGNATRQVNNMIQPGFPAERVLVVEVLTPAGNWSSYPPHKHDENRPPEEVVLEEVYYYRGPAPEAFGVQRLYTRSADLDLTETVRDGDLLLVPRGYHPFAAAHGYDFYYLNALAGDFFSMAASDDPNLAWTREAWKEEEPDPRVPLVTQGAAA
jgi:5-deoxy-glucuronate isomerase